MNRRKKRVRRYYKHFKKTNFVLLNKILRILSWLLPGLVIKRWMLTSAVGFLTALLGLAIWTNLRPLYWLIEENLKNFELAFARIGNKKMDAYICDRFFDYIIRRGNLDKFKTTLLAY